MNAGINSGAARDLDATLFERRVGEGVDGDVEALKRRVSADISGPDDTGDKSGSAFLMEDRLAKRLVLESPL